MSHAAIDVGGSRWRGGRIQELKAGSATGTCTVVRQ
jgi:hypothetical protein